MGAGCGAIRLYYSFYHPTPEFLYAGYPSTSAPVQGRSRTRRPLPDLLVSRAIPAGTLCSCLSLPERGRSQSPSAPGGRVEVQNGTLPGARADRPQYFLFSGIAPRTPPRGSATSPAYRGMRWTWRCITVWPAAFPTLTPTL